MDALLIIDMQMEMQRRLDLGRPCVHPDAPARIAALARAFRASGRPVIHVRHRSDKPSSPFHAASAGFAPMPCALETAGEAVFVKHTSSAFASTDLAAHLHAQGISALVVAGAVAGFCVNSTVRAASDLGFKITIARDAVMGFDLPGSDQSAQVIFDVTMAQLAADFATLADTATLLPHPARP
jgi:nicotinamidase-related amidase